MAGAERSRGRSLPADGGDRAGEGVARLRRGGGAALRPGAFGFGLRRLAARAERERIPPGEGRGGEKDRRQRIRSPQGLSQVPLRVGDGAGRKDAEYAFAPFFDPRIGGLRRLRRRAFGGADRRPGAPRLEDRARPRKERGTAAPAGACGTARRLARRRAVGQRSRAAGARLRLLGKRREEGPRNRRGDPRRRCVRPRRVDVELIETKEGR